MDERTPHHDSCILEIFCFLGLAVGDTSNKENDDQRFVSVAALPAEKSSSVLTFLGTIEN
jgi:hypothetical protein